MNFKRSNQKPGAAKGVLQWRWKPEHHELAELNHPKRRPDSKQLKTMQIH